MDGLDDPVWEALGGPHAALALSHGRARRYPAEVSPFAAVAALADDALRDLCTLVPAGDFVLLFSRGEPLPAAGWQLAMRVDAIQMVCERPVASPQREPAPLGASDVDAMCALAARTEPGPFGRRTLEMGRYVGFKEGGRLLAMGGERLRPPGYTEVSGICTAPEARGSGFADAIVRGLTAEIQARGEVPFLHVRVGSPSEATALALYGRVGFRERRRVALEIAQPRAR